MKFEFNFSPLHEHIFQLVAAELFPVMVDSSEKPSYIGISAGFALGLGLIYGMEHLVEYIEENDGRICTRKKEESVHSVAPSPVKTYPRGYEQAGTADDAELNELVKQVELGAWREEEVERSSKILSSPAHRTHIQDHLHELSELVKFIEEKVKDLFNPEISVRECEHIAEYMDEKVHTLQYKLDHTRRYVLSPVSVKHFLIECWL